MIRIRSVVERKAVDLPPYLTVDASIVEPLGVEETTPIELAIDGVPVGRRMLKYWGDDRKCWFVDLTRRQIAAAGVEIGADVSVEFELADDSLPKEIGDVIEGDPESRARWERFTPGRQRQIAESVRSAAGPATRERRARRLLAPPE